MNLEQIEKVINEIRNELKVYHIPEIYLSKFQDNKIDKEFLSYVNGVGGSYCKFLALLIKKLNIKNIVELGNREGLSTLCIYSSLPSDASFTTIDLEHDQRYCPDEMFADSRVRFLFGDVSDLDIYKGHLPNNIELLFSDTIHFDFQLRDEWSIYKNFMAEGSLLAIDDINLNDKRKLFDELPYPKWDLTDICHSSGWGLVFIPAQPIQNIDLRVLNAYKASVEIYKRKFLEMSNLFKIEENKKLRSRVRSFLHKHHFLHNISLYLRGKL